LMRRLESRRNKIYEQIKLALLSKEVRKNEYGN
jgi:hypothetical protein